MFKSSILAIIFISTFLPQNIIAQETNSLQVSGGIIEPMSSARGLSGALQFNYSLNSNINFYIYSGYSSWDFYRIFFYKEREGRDPQLFRLIGADEHSMVPVYLGSRINFHTIKL
ncbi:MAG TPA: hypothetical protein VLB50_01565, partial [Ignavibacteriaceae bacterium]|nr:hypothetical protein [Ignavibacteriaceae bacterium]